MTEKSQVLKELLNLKHSQEGQPFIKKFSGDEGGVYLYCEFDPCWEDLEAIREFGDGSLMVGCDDEDGLYVLIGLED